MVGSLVQRRREAKGLTQTELALITGLRQTYISQVERGEIRLPRDHNLDALGAALDLKRADFYRAAGVLEGYTPDAAEGDAPDDPLLDVLAWLREDPAIVADFAEAKATMKPEVYRAYVRAVAGAWASNARMQRETWRLAREG